MNLKESPIITPINGTLLRITGQKIIRSLINVHQMGLRCTTNFTSPFATVTNENRPVYLLCNSKKNRFPRP